MNRRDLLRLGAAAIFVPTAEYVRRFFPVGIDLRRTWAPIVITRNTFTWEATGPDAFAGLDRMLKEAWAVYGEDMRRRPSPLLEIVQRSDSTGVARAPFTRGRDG